MSNASSRAKSLIAALFSLLVALFIAGCAVPVPPEAAPEPEAPAQSEAAQPEEATAEPEEAPEPEEAASAEPAPVEKNGDIYILYTSDVHCGVSEGFGYIGLQQVRDSLEAQGFETILVDDGDSVQGDSIGTLSKGEAVIELMNALRYDVAVPGNHEFDYGMDRFFELVGMAEHPYICCNLTKGDERIFDPYIIIERAGKKIAFVGIVTPQTLTESTPTLFQDENGNYIYGFMRDDSGQELCAAVQEAVDAARAEGADYVYVMGHLGMKATDAPWTYADVIENTRGIDVFFDGHSHDTDQVAVKNLDGVEVPRSACGTKLNCIGYSHISADGEIVETGIWSWPNETPMPELLGIENSMSEPVETALRKLDEQLNVVVGHTDFDLTISDPEAVDTSGNPIRMVRRAETNLGDFCADAIRAKTGAEIGFVNGGGVRTTVPKGDITYGNLIDVQPFANEVTAIRATGQQILDALEWGVRDLPAESGGFLQVSGMSFTIDLTVESSCTADENNMFTGVAGERRIKDAYVGDEPLDPERVYLVGGTDYFLINRGGGNTAFDGAEVVLDKIAIDHQALIEYLEETLDGQVPAEYSDPYGQDRITVIGG